MGNSNPFDDDVDDGPVWSDDGDDDGDAGNGDALADGGGTGAGADGGIAGSDAIAIPRARAGSEGGRGRSASGSRGGGSVAGSLGSDRPPMAGSLDANLRRGTPPSDGTRPFGFLCFLAVYHTRGLLSLR